MAVAEVQTANAQSVSGAAITMTPGAGFTAGNTIVIGIVYYQSAATPLSISSVTNQSATPVTYSEPSTQRFATDTGLNFILIQNVPSGTTGLIVTMSGAPAFGSNWVLGEYSGLVTSGTDGASSLSASASTSTDAVTSGTASNTVQPAAVIGIATDSAFNTIPIAGTGFTSNVGIGALRLEFKRITATGSQAATFTNNHGSSCNHITAMVVLDEPGGGGATSKLLRMLNNQAGF